MFQLTAGLSQFQVLQRDRDGFASVVLSGTCDADLTGEVEARVLLRAFPAENWDWKSVGSAFKGEWSANLEMIPAGGPYRVEIRAAEKPAESVLVKDILVGDIWVLAGQSNMEGMGDLVNVERQNPLVHSFDMTDTWLPAEEPLHWLCDSPDPVHTDQSEPFKTQNAHATHTTRTKGAGLGLPFASELVKRTGIPIGLIPCAHGGTSMREWDPSLRDRGGKSLYGSMYRRFLAAGGAVRGVLWYQGETDAHEGRTKEYRSSLEKLIAAFRNDLGNADLPFLMVQIGRWIAPPAREYPPHWNAIQEIQRSFATQPNVAVVASVDLELDDGIHIGTQGLKQLGRRLACAAHTMVFDGGPASGPEFHGAKIESNRIRVSFVSVNNKLLNEPRISGFSLRDRRGEELHLVFDVTVDPIRPSEVIVHLTERPPRDARLSYGFGHDPYCNLTDALGLAALAFGPVELT